MFKGTVKWGYKFVFDILEKIAANLIEKIYYTD